MKKNKHTKILFIILAFVLISFSGIIYIKNEKAVKAAGNGVENKIASILAKYPDGSYFSSTGGPCGPGQTNFGAGNYCTYCQLYVMDKAAYAACGNGDSCNSFAKYVFYNIFGLNPRNCSVTKCNNPNDVAKTGDFITCCNDNGNEVHYSIYIGPAGGNSFYAYEANVSKENLVKYNFLHTSQYGNLWPKYKVYHANNYDQVNDTSYPNGGNNQASLSYSNLHTEFVDTWNAGLYGEVDNPGRLIVSEVGVWIWDSAGNLVVEHKEDCGRNTSFEQRLNIVGEAFPDGLKSGESYTWQMFAISNGNVYKSGTESFTITDNESPVISNVQVKDITPEGYTITCTVTDNYKIEKVQFPTWTDKNGQDDLVQDWKNDPKISGTKNGDTYTFYVNISDHNNETGIYKTHIYAWDKQGNSSKHNELNEIIVPEKSPEVPAEESASPTPEITKKPAETTPTPEITKKPIETTPVPIQTMTPVPTPDIDTTNTVPPSTQTGFTDITINSLTDTYVEITAKISKQYSISYWAVYGTDVNNMNYTPIQIANGECNMFKIEIETLIPETKYYAQLCFINSDGAKIKSDIITFITHVQEKDEYTITFDANGGSCESSTLITLNKKLPHFPKAKRDGYTFDGWYTDKYGGTKVYILITTFYEDTTLYARWKAKQTPTSNDKPNAPSIDEFTVYNVKGKLYIEIFTLDKVNGYQIQYSKNKTFSSSNVKKSVKTNKYVYSKKYSGLQNGKKYYVKARAYINYNGKKIYGPWSKVKKVKIRKK